MRKVYLNENYFRPKTRHESVHIHFFLSQGGLGDYINHMPAFQWLAEKCPHLEGRLFVNKPFLEVAEFIMRPYKQWKVINKVLAPKFLKTGDAVVDPVNYKKFINATGAHLLDLGFMFYACHDKPYAGYNRLPSINYSKPWRWPELNPDWEYAIFTPGATAQARAVPAKHFNNLVDYTISKGVTPVFLGKADFAGLGKKEGSSKGYYAKFDEGYDFSRGVDLREKTTLLEAVQIMRGAKFVIGVDNGLLHFAGCTEVPIIFGHTVAEVEHRKIRRPKGLTIDIAISRDSLPCIGCQSNMRYIMGHQFKFCIYGDYQCLDLIFADDARTWKQAIDVVLEHGTGSA